MVDVFLLCILASFRGFDFLPLIKSQNRSFGLIKRNLLLVLQGDDAAESVPTELAVDNVDELVRQLR